MSRLLEGTSIIPASQVASLVGAQTFGEGRQQGFRSLGSTGVDTNAATVTQLGTAAGPSGAEVARQGFVTLPSTRAESTTRSLQPRTPAVDEHGVQPDAHPKRRGKMRPGTAIALLAAAAALSGCAVTATGSGASAADSSVASSMRSTLEMITPSVQKGGFMISQDGQTSGMDLEAGQEVELSADGPGNSQIDLTVGLTRNDSLQGATVEEVADLQQGSGYEIFLRYPLYSYNLDGPYNNTGEKDTFDVNGNLVGTRYTWHLDQRGDVISDPQDAQFAASLNATVKRDVAAVLSHPTPASPEIAGY